MNTNTLTPELLHKMDAYWRAANYLSVGQIYLYDNPLLKRPLMLADVKHMLLGHWGTTPGQNFIYVHLNRVIKKYDLDMIYVSGPGHGGPAVVGNTYLEGTYSEIYPNISQDEAGLQKLFLQFSFPGGIPSHASPECPGSIHEGGELGYSLSHSFGAVFDNPDLVVACVVGDGEAETGPLATAWHSNKFLDPVTDGAVLPILHLNGYKIANPTVLARIEHEELEQLLRGYGWMPFFVEGHEPALMHEAMAATLDTAVEQIKKIQQDARVHGNIARPRWPMIVLNSPKGWTGPKLVDGLQIEGTFRSHQVPLHPAAHPEHLKLLEDWLRSYRPEQLFDEQGRLKPELAELAPKGDRRMGANPHANGGMLLRDLRMPDFRDYAVDVTAPGVRGIGDTHVLGCFLRDVAKLNSEQRNFRVFGPDETLSNGLEGLFEVTKRQWDAATVPNDEFLAPTGRVMEMLSEHQCEGWLEGYVLTGRHGLFNCYEAFIHIIDSMFNQHAKWLKGHGKPVVAAQDRLAQLPAGLACLAPGSQRLHAPGSRFHRPSREQESRGCTGLLSTGCKLPAVGDGPLPAQPPLRQRRDRGKTPGAAVADDGRRRQALHPRHRYLAVGQQRSTRRARRGHGLLWRRAHAGDARRRLHPA
jgi:xylulose-5-phosphate/fructose-6-phosphate phosphoketolase